MKSAVHLITLLLLATVVSAARPTSRSTAPVPRVRAVLIEGNAAIPSSYLIPRLTLKIGQPLRKEQLKFSAGVIESTYRDKGYYEVAVTTEVVSSKGWDVDVVFRVREGSIFHIGKISISGNKIIEDKVILRGINIKSGDLFSQSKIFEGNRDLYMLGYFDTIDVTYSTSTASQIVDVSIRVKERSTRFIKGGLGYGTQTKERVTLGFEDLNFLGNGRKLDVTGTHSGFVTEPSRFRTTLVQTKLTQPFIFGTRLDGQTDISREWDEREAYDSIQTSWRTSVGRRFGPEITTNLHYRFQGTRVTRVSPFAQTPGFTNVSAIGPTFTYDNTNDPFLPSIGWRVIGTFEEGLRLFNGDVRFHKLESRVGRFDTEFGGWTLFEGLQAGLILPDSTADHDIIPIFERYFLGGANSIRGYNERELGPRDQTGAPLGGNAFLVGNLELRHKIYKKIFGVVFLDGGQLYPTDPGARWPHMRLHELDDFRYATGAGIRLHSPVGAIRLEFGYKLNPEGPTNFLNRAGIHFSIGEVF